MALVCEFVKTGTKLKLVILNQDPLLVKVVKFCTQEYVMKENSRTQNLMVLFTEWNNVKNNTNILKDFITKAKKMALEP